MEPSNNIKTFIASQEGCKLIAYRPIPTDRWTIGYGSTYINNSPIIEGQQITAEQAQELLSNTIDNVAQQLSKHFLPGKLTQNQFDAVISLAYNIGIGAFMNSNTGVMFYSGEDISNKFTEWDESSGVVIPGLLTRRQKEKLIYDSAIYT